MIDELDIFGVYMPAALVWAIIGGILAFTVRLALQRLPLERQLWQTGLLDIALFLLLWWGVSALADLLLPLVTIR
ncbi:DUF1656 domain-containing protein [Acidocella sp. KAb 2-4]|uniref:DUF1656 domain-containing protein n=1 Tax=Acidocella sp. KAb 2-4 TaxID=2885158 RepID=UPI001D06CE73|nr:DUF1656 domain-containing protein [Acidocella sp. KAb 2-4]MCB5944658.1 DUF1656 domain-containing protein [Acidocella sp. KAb 2-4]